jgi:hypothetical protein
VVYRDVWISISDVAKWLNKVSAGRNLSHVDSGQQRPLQFHVIMSWIARINEYYDRVPNLLFWTQY